MARRNSYIARLAATFLGLGACMGLALVSWQPRGSVRAGAVVSKGPGERLLKGVDGTTSVSVKGASEGDVQGVALLTAEHVNDERATTGAVYVSNAAGIRAGSVTLAKRRDARVNAVLYCPDERYSTETGECLPAAGGEGWEIADIRPTVTDDRVQFSVSHFSAYAGAYLELLTHQADLSVNDTWAATFQTYGTSDLSIEAVDGTEFGRDLSFISLSCGDGALDGSRLEWEGNLLTVLDYSCDGARSTVRNQAVSPGRHWLEFRFGDSVEKGHNFACDSGTLATTCTVSTSQTIADGDILSGSGNLVIANGGALATARGDRFSIDMQGSVTIQDGGRINGNLALLRGSSIFVSGNAGNGGGVIDASAKGYAGGAGGTSTPGTQLDGSGPGGGKKGTGFYAGGGGHGGDGGAQTGGYGSAGEGGLSGYDSGSAPDFGSGGGGMVSGVAGGNGGGLVVIETAGTLTLGGSILADGQAGNGGGADRSGAGAGGFVRITAAGVGGSGTVSVRGGASSYSGSGGGGIVVADSANGLGGIVPAVAGGDGISGSEDGAAGYAVLSGMLISGNASLSSSGFTRLESSAYSYSLTSVTQNAQLRLGSSVGTASLGDVTLADGGGITVPGTATALTASSLSVSSGTGILSVAKNIATKPSFGSLSVPVGTVLTHAANASSHDYSLILSVSGNVTIAGSIDVSAKGYAGGLGGNGNPGSAQPGYGPGAGQRDTGWYYGSGGGYGGGGGYSGGGTGGGAAYGSSSAPTDVGSGGASMALSGSRGGNGGGAVRLVVGGTLTVSGNIVANGGNGTNGSGEKGAGGSGGSIWISAGTVTGSGAILARGGGSDYSGGGGGGRIALDYSSSNTYSGTLSVVGGTTGSGGGNGTAGTSTAAAPPIQLVVSGISDPIVAGTPASLTVTAVDGNGATNPAFTGTIAFTSSDQQAILPTAYTFTLADAGSRTFSAAITLRTSGEQWVAANDAVHQIGGTQVGITVTPAAFNGFSVVPSGSAAQAGSALGATVTARDAYGNTVTDYAGTIAFSSDDSLAVLPSGYTYGPYDLGTREFPGQVSFRTAGSRSLSVRDTADAQRAGTAGAVTVIPGDATTFVLTGLPGTTVAGVPISLTVTANDAYGNVATGYRGTVSLASSDQLATLPAPTGFTAAENGVAQLSGIVLKAAGSRTITVADTQYPLIARTSGSISVTPAAAQALVVSGLPEAPTADTVGTLTVTAKDVYGNVATAYQGGVVFSANDAQAVLPAAYVFTQSDGGQKTFADVALRTAGTRIITVADQAASVEPAVVTRTIAHGAPAKLVLSLPEQPLSEQAPFALTLAVQDAYGNLATGYTGSVALISDDPAATIPATYQFTPADGGTKTFPAVSFGSSGSRSLKAVASGPAAPLESARLLAVAPMPVPSSASANPQVQNKPSASSTPAPATASTATNTTEPTVAPTATEVVQAPDPAASVAPQADGLPQESKEPEPSAAGRLELGGLAALVIAGAIAAVAVSRKRGSVSN